MPVAAEELSQSALELDLDTPVLGALARELFEAGGIRGMVGGQWLDLEAEGRQLDLEGLRAVHRAKTGALIGAAVTIGALAAQASAPVLAALKAFGDDVGLAFQVADDVLDATRTSAELGKTAGKDAEVAKSTYVGLLGVAAAREKADMLARSAIAALAPAGVPDVKLAALARYIVDRES